MHLEVITPESQIFTGEVTAVQFPGKNGLFQVLSDHAPIISVLKEGEMKVDLKDDFMGGSNESVTIDPRNKKVIRIKVNGGIVEMLNNKIIVLAE